MTQEDLLMQFQRDHVDWNGLPLDADGDLGPKSRYALAIADLPLFRRRIYSELMLCHGQHETHGPNRSPWIDARVQRTGGKLGDPWCAALVHTVLIDSGVECLRTMSSVACLRQFPLTQHPEPMDIGGWENGDGTGHVFFVAGYWFPRPNVEGVATFEGNSDNRFRLCLREMEGLQFRRVVAPNYAAIINATAGTRVTRQVQGTR